MRKPIIAGNWKMNKLAADGARFVLDFRSHLPMGDKVDVVVCPPYPHLPLVVEAARDYPMDIGAQNMHFEDSGAFTGEVSPEMLKDLLVEYVILGHSERREHFQESDELINKKLKAAFDHQMTPIVCVGESLEQRVQNQAYDFVESQVKAAFDGVSAEQAKVAVVAYEPIWAIGTGKTASSDDANDMCAHIRNVLKDLYDESVSEAVRIQYGGSVKPANIDELLAKSDIDGALVGGASLEKDSFLKLLEAGANA
ncbi:triose-phosphate isomerase [Halalkalibacillus halophilus]|uniref:triose-phosphate isomerase n=1 Tax=Halalkalibacillus halophilus TaxID=392827 RepID=UPI0003F97DF3|nr:triose-phosphate isomerase [Halalkalibacillus halophilus]